MPAREKFIVHQMPLDKPVTGQDLHEVQQRLAPVFDQLDAKPHLDSYLLEDIALLAASTTNVTHKLGRRWRGFHVVKRDANATVWSPASTMDAALYLPLACSADVNVSIVVF